MKLDEWEGLKDESQGKERQIVMLSRSVLSNYREFMDMRMRASACINNVFVSSRIEEARKVGLGYTVRSNRPPLLLALLLIHASWHRDMETVKLSIAIQVR